MGKSPLARLLVTRACENFELANYLNWYLRVEVEDRERGRLFDAVYSLFIEELSKRDAQRGSDFADRLMRQLDMLGKAFSVGKDAAKAGKVEQKVRHDRVADCV